MMIKEINHITMERSQKNDLHFSKETLETLKIQFFTGGFPSFSRVVDIVIEEKMNREEKISLALFIIDELGESLKGEVKE